MAADKRPFANGIQAKFFDFRQFEAEKILGFCKSAKFQIEARRPIAMTDIGRCLGDDWRAQVKYINVLLNSKYQVQTIAKSGNFENPQILAVSPCRLMQIASSILQSVPHHTGAMMTE